MSGNKVYVCYHLCICHTLDRVFEMHKISDKNSTEVDITPAFGEITTACNVGQAKKGHRAC